MENLNQIIAANLKELRKKKGLSLEQVSVLTSISKSMLSQLERGEVNPTISTVYKLALGLKVPVTAFTASRPRPFTSSNKHQLSPLTGDDGRYRLYPILVSGNIRILRFLTWNLMKAVRWTATGRCSEPGSSLPSTAENSPWSLMTMHMF